MIATSPVSPILLWLALNSLLVYRLALIFTVDEISEPWRKWLTTRYHGWLVDLLVCPPCLAVWFSAAALVLTWQVPTTWFWIALGGAIAGVADLLFKAAKIR